METLTEKFNTLKELGFNTPDFQSIKSNQIGGCFEAKSKQRASLDYDIDGLVFSLDNIDDMLDMGMADKMRPKGQIALKFPAESSIVEIIDIHPSYEGKNFIGLVAEFNPVTTQGAILRRASLKSYRWVKENNVGVGSIVEIVRSGDVIPKIEKVISNLIADQSKIPTKCEICGAELDITQAHLQCANEECPAKEAARITNFMKTLGVKGYSWKTLLDYTKEGVTLYDFIAKRYDVIERAGRASGQSEKVWEKIKVQLESN